MPITAYHATSAKFDVFDTSKGDLGAHFGGLAQAVNHCKRRFSGVAGARVLKCRLDLVAPLRLRDVGSFHADGIAPQLASRGLLPSGLSSDEIVRECDADWRRRKHFDPLIRKAIIDAGYDGVVYSNRHEGKGDSFIVFDAAKILIEQPSVLMPAAPGPCSGPDI